MYGFYCIPALNGKKIISSKKNNDKSGIVNFLFNMLQYMIEIDSIVKATKGAIKQMAALNCTKRTKKINDLTKYDRFYDVSVHITEDLI